MCIFFAQDDILDIDVSLLEDSTGILENDCQENDSQQIAGNSVMTSDHSVQDETVRISEDIVQHDDGTTESTVDLYLVMWPV